MKKFIAGFVAGALLFCGVPAFADSIKNILGAKVTGIYTVQKSNGEKIAEGAIINGSTYVPVRAISEATGAALNVDTKAKVITLEEANALNTTDESIPEVVKDGLREDLKGYESRLVTLNEKLKAAESDTSTDNSEFIELLNEKIEETKTNIAEIQTKLGE